MPFLYPFGKVIFFAHVPKTGGSSVEDYLTRRFGALSMSDRHKREGTRGTGLISPVTHLSALDLVEILPREIDLCFAVVRNPLKRMLSEYRWQHGISWASRMSFSTWLRIVIYAAGLDSRVYENHIRPQSEMVPDDAEVFRLEDGFEMMIQCLDTVVGTTSPEITMGHLLKRRSNAPITVTREDADLIVKFYASDYTRFGYDTPDTRELKSDPFAFGRTLLAVLLAWVLVAKQRWSWVR